MCGIWNVYLENKTNATNDKVTSYVAVYSQPFPQLSQFVMENNHLHFGFFWSICLMIVWARKKYPQAFFLLLVADFSHFPEVE